MFSQLRSALRAAFVAAATISIVAGGAATLPVAAADTYTMKIGTASVNDQQFEWMKTYKANLEKDSGGRIKVDLYPSSQLGSIPRMIEGVQFGSIQAIVTPPDFFVGVDQRFGVVSIPGTLKSFSHLEKTIADPEFRKSFLALGAEKGVVGIGLFPNDADSLVTRKPVTSLAEIKGLKVRITAGRVLEKMMSVMGATGVPMPLDQVMTAVQQGAIDGVYATVAVITPMKFYTSAPDVLLLPDAYSVSVTEISKQWLASLPEDLQKLVVADGLKTDKQLDPFIEKFNVQQREIYTSNGGKIVKLPAAEELRVHTLWAPIGKEAIEANPALKGIHDDLETAAAKYK